MSAPQERSAADEPKPQDHTAPTPAPTSSDEIVKVKSPSQSVDSQKDKAQGNEKSGPPSEQEYPGPVQVAIIMTCILSAIFLMSLVSLSIAASMVLAGY